MKAVYKPDCFIHTVCAVQKQQCNCVAQFLFYVDPICSVTQYWLPAENLWGVCECSFTHRRISFPSFALKFKKNARHLPPSVASSSLSPSSLHRSHSSCVPERSARLISARLCVSCRVSPKALLAPLAEAAVRFQTAWADGCLPNQSVLLSLISIFQTSIYFPLASQDRNSVELIINNLAVFLFHIFPPPLLPLKAVMVSKFLPLLGRECRVDIQW